MRQVPFENMLRGYLFPTWGHSKINKWKRGAKIYIGGLLISMGLGIAIDAISQKTEDNDPAGFIYTMLGGAITHIWCIVDVGKQTKIYNENLYRKIYQKEPPTLSLNIQPKYQGANLIMTYSFH